MSQDVLSPVAANLLLGKGQLLFDRFTSAGLATGFRHMGNVEEFSIELTDEKAEKFTSQNQSAGLYKSVTTKRTTALAVQADEFAIANIALGMMGDEDETTQAGATIVDEALTTSVTLGKYYQTLELGISAESLEADPGGTPTALVLGTDYVILDAIAGIIQILPTAVNTVDGEAIDIDYTSAAYTGATALGRVKGATQTNVEGAVLFIPDPSTGPKLFVEVWRVSVSPNGPVGFISDDYANFTLTMEVQDESVAHPGEGFYVVTQLPA